MKKEELKDLPDPNDNDLTDSPEDIERIRHEEVILDLPEVEDIPGKENIIPLKMNAFADTSNSSDDEEDLELINEDDEEK